MNELDLNLGKITFACSMEENCKGTKLKAEKPSGKVSKIIWLRDKNLN